MSSTVIESSVYKELRTKAEAQLKSGTAPTTGNWSLGMDALSTLHRLSSDPNSAGDALKLLHELQVHQVELDLQIGEIQTNEQELIEDLAYCRALFACAPMGYFVVDPEGNIIEGNLAGAVLFGVGQGDLAGHRIDRFLAPEHRPALLAMLDRIVQGSTRGNCVVLTESAGDYRQLQLMASVSVDHGHILLSCCEVGGTGATS